ncbi:MAG: alpha-ketoglutarate-dependent dioxygenase AlkB [Gemmataceae bacterium]|nr:alpha-ketoglutarate-dependent dioxygenase AlkB [Gemmataceae bacterium]MCI0743525.1 alpha-ketoglutarate-dependent dioxygenase AlkB [Gemmataceae bacterium]
MESQPLLFDDTPVDVDMDVSLDIPGLNFIPNFLNRDEEQRLLTEIDQLQWLTELKRRVQHYGYKYDYKARRVDGSMYLGPLPPFAEFVARRLVEQGHVEQMPDQCIVNEYRPGQGIAAHIDCEPCFQNTIVTVSLGSTYEMDFIHKDTGERRQIPLLARSALIMRDEGRYQWLHGIKARTSEKWGKRARRVSLTFRNVISQRESGVT